MPSNVRSLNFDDSSISPHFVKPQRYVDKVYIHCSAASGSQFADISIIRAWHLARGFDDVGYHYFITYDGVIQKGRDLELTPAAQKGNNTGSIAICLAGLLPQDFTFPQLDALVELCYDINWEYESITFHGHNEVSTKTCPVFNYKETLHLDERGVLGATKPNISSLSIFDTGIEVARMQRRLNKWIRLNQHVVTNNKGQTIQGVRIDGVFGNITANILRIFQGYNNLPKTGIFDPLTNLALPSIRD